ncbi:uncharacterized protein RAG0_00273 [Rhynchosporium agropyri]|uniref:Uncharacterized protein n=1 Tax=Rhynchosporium agropyri TaxID=914238 RepID=A0A1E1JRQ4_9HELO|nr:uncharacterized protein RAG0_00273 [Rhynchosporium agropyri]
MAPAKRYGIKALSEIEIILTDVGTDDISDQYDEHQRNGHEENTRTWDLALGGGKAAASTGSSDSDFSIDVVAAVKGTRQAYGQSQRQQHDNQQDFNGQDSAGIENSDWEPFEGFRVGVPRPPDMKELDGVNPLPKIGATEEGDTDAASLRQKQKENERFTTKSEDGEAYTRTLKDIADDETLLARQTPGVSIQQLEALSAHLNNTLIPETNALFNAAFSDLAARDEAHELLSQRIWREVTHESRLAATKDPEARTLKKGLVSETQYAVHRLYDALEMARK